MNIPAQFTMAAFLNVFEHFIGHYRLLLNDGGGCDPSSPAAKEVEELVSARVSACCAPKIQAEGLDLLLCAFRSVNGQIACSMEMLSLCQRGRGREGERS